MKAKVLPSSFLSRFYCIALLATGVAAAASGAILLDIWDAADLSATHANGSAVANWTSKSNRVSLPVTTAPTFAAAATPTGLPAVWFNNSLMKTTGPDSPVSGRTEFSLAFVFKANAAGSGTIQQWYNNTGIVDSETPNAANDWGTAFNGIGQVCLGIGNPDVTVYAPGPSVMDGGFHVVVATWSGSASNATIFLDGNPSLSVTVAGAARSSLPMAFGGLQSAANSLFNGYISEIQFYAESLAPSDATNVAAALGAKHGVGIVGVIITRQPAAQQVFTGRPFELTVGVSGPSPTYQWYKDGTDPTNALPNALSSTFTVSSASTADAGNYQVIVTSPNNAVTSAVARVTVSDPIPVASGLAGYWKLDETSGTTAADASGGGHPGTVINNAGDQWTSGQVGGAMTFRGPNANDYIAVTNLPMPAGNSFSLAFWVYRDPGMLVSDAWRMIYFSGAAGFPDGPFSCRDNGNNSGLVRPGVYQSNGTLIAAADPQPLPVNTWTHYVMLADGAKLRVYRNGVEVASAGYDGTLKKPVQPSTALTIGGFINNGALTGKFWQGRYDDIAYWTRALSAEEVRLVFAAGANRRSIGDLNLEVGSYTTNWVAYNDLNQTPSAVVLPNPAVNNGWGTAPNVCQYDEQYGPGGPLTNYISGPYAAGTTLPVSMLISPLTPVGSPFATPTSGFGYPNPGTPAFNLFNGIVDLSNPGSGVGLSVGSLQQVVLTFTNLDPTMRYAFRGTTVRAGPTLNTHDVRWTYCEISGASSFVDAHTPGCLTAATVLPGLHLSPGQVVFQTGINTNGDIVDWEDIVPGADGTFSIIQRGYGGVVTNIYGTMAGGTTVTNAFSNIGYVLAGLQVMEYGALSPLMFVSQPPASNGVLQLRSLTLNPKVAGTAPQYQWYKQGVGALSGATGPNYTIPSAQSADAGTYYLVAGSAIGSVTSTLAQVFVILDTNPPVFVNTACYPTFDWPSRAGRLNGIILEFNEPLDPVTAVNPANWIIQAVDFGLALAVQSVLISNNNQTVFLVTDDQIEGARYQISANAVTDPAGNGIVQTPLFTSWIKSPLNGLLWEYYATGGGVTIPNLTNYAGYPNSPAAWTNLWSFDTRVVFPDDTHDYYGDRIRGWFIPPVSGNWVFYVRSDDAGQVYFNPAGADAAGKVLILDETGCCGDYDKYTSPTFPLVAGQPYYIESLHKEGGGGDYIKVAARLATDGKPPLGVALLSIDPATINGPAVGYPYAPKDLGGAIYVSQVPTNTLALGNNYVSFSVAASNALGWPMSYQWVRNGTDIPEATQPTYTFITALADEGTRFAVRVSKFGSVVTTLEVVLTVIPDLTPPPSWRCMAPAG